MEQASTTGGTIRARPSPRLIQTIAIAAPATVTTIMRRGLHLRLLRRTALQAMRLNLVR